MSIIVDFPLPFMTCAFTLLSLQQGLWLLSRQPMTCDCDLSQGAEPGGLRKLHCACPRGSEKAASKETNSRELCTNRCTARCASNCPLDIFPSHLTSSAFTCYRSEVTAWSLGEKGCQSGSSEDDTFHITQLCWINGSRCIGFGCKHPRNTKKVSICCNSVDQKLQLGGENVHIKFQRPMLTAMTAVPAVAS